MLKRSYKLIICVVLVATLLFSFSVAQASAEVVGLAAGAGLLGSALGSLGVELLAGGAATAATLGLWLNGDFSIIGSLTGVADGYIKVADNSVTIDGVQYESIFLDPSLAAELHTQAFDFVTQKAITANSSGLLASGAGYSVGVPFYNVNGSIRTQDFYLPYSYHETIYSNIGDVNFSTYSDRVDGSRGWYSYAVNNPPPASGTLGYNFYNPTYLSYNSNFDYVYLYPFSSGANLLNGVLFDNEPFTFTYVSGSIDVAPLPSDYGFQAYVPSSALSGAGISGGTYVIDGGVGEDTIIELIQLLDDLYGQNEIVDAEFTEETAPTPPVPDTTIADTSYSTLHDELIDIKNHQAHSGSVLENIDSGVDVIGRSVDNIDQTLTGIDGYLEQGITDIVDSVDTFGQSVVDGLSDVEDAIDTFGQSVVSELGRLRSTFDTIGQSVISILQGIRTAIGTVVTTITDAVSDITDVIEGLAEQVLEDIQTAPINVFSTALDVIKLAFAPIIAALKACIGLWHYVVEWVQVTAPVFSTFFGLMSGTSYNMVLPIYAALAGPIVIAIYKRFGK